MKVTKLALFPDLTGHAYFFEAPPLLKDSAPVKHATNVAKGKQSARVRDPPVVVVLREGFFVFIPLDKVLSLEKFPIPQSKYIENFHIIARENSLSCLPRIVFAGNLHIQRQQLQPLCITKHPNRSRDDIPSL